MQLQGSTLPIFPPPPSDPSLRPADALLRESTRGQSQYSPATQHETIVALMARQGYYPACIDGDEERGRVTTRAGYQRIKARVHAGLTEAVFVFHSSRLDRDAAERIRLQRDLKKLHVPIFSAQQGELRADLVGGVYALMDEQFSVDLAYKIKHAMPSAVENGEYPTRTPIGYKRIWPTDQLYRRKQAALMVEDEHYGPLVRDIFAKYALGDWSIRAIVRWLNGQLATHPNPASASGQWNRALIGRMLRMRIYAGEVEWGRTKSGYYDHYDGPVLVRPSRHPALIERAVWEAAQMRLDNEDKRLQTTTRKGRTPALLSGFLVCAACGAPVAAQRERPSRRGSGQYICSARQRCQSDCREPSISMALAEGAVLREVARLQGRPWVPTALDPALLQDQHALERQQIEDQIAQARRDVERNVALLRLVEQPDPETLAVFRRDNKELAERIARLQERLDALPVGGVSPVTVEQVHARLAATDLAGLIQEAQAPGGDVLLLRELLAATVQRARIGERCRPGLGRHATWARAEVTWTDDVALLLDAGLLTLGPPEALPVPASPRERARRYRARKRARGAS